MSSISTPKKKKLSHITTSGVAGVKFQLCTTFHKIYYYVRTGLSIYIKARAQIPGPFLVH